jgi:hypothetical protein
MLGFYGRGPGGIFSGSSVRVFYATLARKAPFDPVGSALLHCLDGLFD